MAACAFIVHPLSPGQRRLFGARLADPAILRGRAGNRVAEIARLRVPTRSAAVTVHVVMVPDLPADLVRDQRRALRLLIEASRIAEQLGARAIGLGSALAVVAGRGAALQEHTSLPVTTGHAATAWCCAALTRAASGDEPIGVLGFQGTVGDAVSQLLRPKRVLVDAAGAASERRARRLGLEPMAREDLLRIARVVVGASTTGPILEPGDLHPGTVLVDLANPPSIAPGPPSPGVTALTGETLRWPHRIDGRFWGRIWRRVAAYEGRSAYACLAEPIAMAATGSHGWSHGRRLDLDAVRDCGRTLTDLGFEPLMHHRRPGARPARTRP